MSSPGWSQSQTVAGHLEAVVEGQDFDVRIDAAQTPDAVAEALAALRARRRRSRPPGLERRGSAAIGPSDAGSPRSPKTAPIV